MDPKQNPFSFYDFLGYFTPGALLIYLIVFTIKFHTAEVVSLDSIQGLLRFDELQMYLPFVLASYILGHLINYLSSITVERYSIWSLDYPSKYLLGVKHEGYFHASENKLLRSLIRFTIGLFLLPVSTLDVILGKWGKMRELYAKKLDDFLITIINNRSSALIKHNKELGFNPDKNEHLEYDSFRYIYHYAVEHSSNHLPKMQNYVALYGFLRTLTFLTVLVFWIILFHKFYSGEPKLFIDLEIVPAALLAFIFYISFVKFYRRFTLEAFMAMTVLSVSD